MRPKRSHDNSSGEFQDPLKDYSSPVYGDEMERSLCEDRVDQMQVRPFAAVESGKTIEQTMRLMCDQNIASVAVTEDGRLVGMFSERDVLNKVVDRYEQIKNHAIREVMTPNPMAVYESDPPAKAINLMAVGGFRHLPILDIEDRVVGMLGPRRITDYIRKHLQKTSP